MHFSWYKVRSGHIATHKKTPTKLFEFVCQSVDGHRERTREVGEHKIEHFLIEKLRWHREKNATNNSKQFGISKIVVKIVCFFCRLLLNNA